jgi:lipid II:glycine glycyltransferase (peptidoglycan interpeptide bridge formation enzyme)
MLFRSGFSRYFNEQSGHATTYRTLVLGLDLSLDELRKRLDQKWRNQLNRAERNGLSIIEDDKTEHYQMFADIYKQMWDRKRFETTVDIKAFGRIQEALPKSQKLKVLICKHANVPVGGIVCSTMGTTAIYVLGATSDSGLKTKGAYLLQWTMIKWLKENGFHNYDLGGIDPEVNPGVYHFKLGLSRQDLSRIPALEACVSALSSVSMKVADFVQCGMRGSFPKLMKWRIARLLRWRGRRSNNG